MRRIVSEEEVPEGWYWSINFLPFLHLCLERSVLFNNIQEPLSQGVEVVVSRTELLL